MTLIQREQRGLHNNTEMTHMVSTMALSLYSKKVLDDPTDEPKSILKEEGVVDNNTTET